MAWKIPLSSEDQWVKDALAQTPGLLLLGEMPSAYNMQTKGLLNLGELALPNYQAGLPDATSMGDHLRLQVASGAPEEGIHYKEAILTDIAGQGHGSLQFASQPDDQYTPALTPPLALAETTYNVITVQDPSTALAPASIDISPVTGSVIVSQAVSPDDGTTTTTVTTTNPEGGTVDVSPALGEGWNNI